MISISEQSTTDVTQPAWADWTPSQPYTIGIEEEAMILDPVDFSLAQRSSDVMAALPDQLAAQVTLETHAAAIELATSAHESALGAAEEAQALRSALRQSLRGQHLRAGAAGTHPSAIWSEMRVSSGERYQLVLEEMRELARREPTFALHVHIGVEDPERAIVLLNRLRAHAPLLLALSANSPFWQGRDTGLCSARTSIFQAFPRVGLPRTFQCYSHYVQTVDELLRCGAFPDPTFLWWDLRPQPSLGTIEVRIMDVQSTSERTGALVALVQAIAHLELEEPLVAKPASLTPELLDENRFLAARDGMNAFLLDPVEGSRVVAGEELRRLMVAGRPHAQQLGCEDAFEGVWEIARESGAQRQRRAERALGMAQSVERLADEF